MSCSDIRYSKNKNLLNKRKIHEFIKRDIRDSVNTPIITVIKIMNKVLDHFFLKIWNLAKIIIFIITIIVYLYFCFT